MEKKRSKTHKSKHEEKNDGSRREDVLATIHVLKNKTQVKKRVVTRHSKDTEKN